MTDKPMLNVARELSALAEKACGTAKDSPEYRRFLEAVNPTLILDLTADLAPQQQGEPVTRHPDAIIEGVMTSVGITHAIYASTVSLKDGEQVKLYAEQPGPVAMTIPEECPHIIVFDDADREQLLFAGTGARAAALKTWEQISASWNAHLFVRVERNSRDDRYPSALSTPLAAVAAKAFAKGFNALESSSGKYRINMQFQSRENAWGAFNVLARLKQLNTPQ